MKKRTAKLVAALCCAGIALSGINTTSVYAKDAGEYQNEQNSRAEEKKGWEYNENGVSYYENNKMVKGFKMIKGIRYYFDEKGSLKTGYQKINNKPYYLGSFSINDAVNGTVEKQETGLVNISDRATGKEGYVFVEDNLSLAIGWRSSDGNKYYFDSEGFLPIGWKEIEGKWYYFGNKMEGLGLYTNGWQDGYWLDADGCWTYKEEMTWYKDDWGWYIWDTSNWYPVSQWQKIEGKWYYFDEWGYMVRSTWRNIGGTYYYFNFDGTLQCGAMDKEGKETGQWIDGYWVDHSGAWTGATAYWYWDGTGYQLWDENGWQAKNSTEIIDNTYINFDANGYANYYGERLMTVPPMGGTGSATKNNVVQYASRVLGFPYVYGGQTIAGTDCSGFTMLSWASQGYNIPHNAGMQYSTYQSNEVWISEVQPGDLLFYMSGDIDNDYGTGIGHVALYIGNGQTLEAGDQTNGYRWYADKAVYVTK